MTTYTAHIPIGDVPAQLIANGRKSALIVAVPEHVAAVDKAGKGGRVEFRASVRRGTLVVVCHIIRIETYTRLIDIVDGDSWEPSMFTGRDFDGIESWSTILEGAYRYTPDCREWRVIEVECDDQRTERNTRKVAVKLLTVVE